MKKLSDVEIFFLVRILIICICYVVPLLLIAHVNTVIPIMKKLQHLLAVSYLITLIKTLKKGK